MSNNLGGIVDSLQDLKNQYPNGTDGVFLVQSTGHGYYYADSWQDEGLLQDHLGYSLNLFNELEISNAKNTQIEKITNGVKISGTNKTSPYKGVRYRIPASKLARYADSQIRISFDAVSDKAQDVSVGIKYYNDDWDNLGADFIEKVRLAAGKSTHADLMGTLDRSIPGTARYEIYFTVDEPEMAVWEVTNMNAQIVADQIHLNNASSLPTFYLTGSTLGMSNKHTKMLKFEFLRDGQSISGYAETKWQGNSSLSWAKKSYRIKTYKDEDKDKKLKFRPISRWLSSHKWNLKAYFTDPTQSRDVVGANLGAEIWSTQKKTPSELIKTSNFGFIDGFPVNVVINGVYAGLYSFNIPKGDYGKTKAQVEGSVYSDVTKFKKYPVGGARLDGSDFELNDPDDLTPEIKESFNRMLQFAIESTDEDFKTHIDDFLDLESIIDYYLFSNIIINTDAWGKNQQLITYDLQKWYLHPYDLDSSLGGEWNGTLKGKLEVTNSAHNLFNRVRQLFPEQIKARYAELQTWLTPAHVLHLYRTKMDTIGEENYQNEFAKWNEPNKDIYTWQQLTDYIIDRFQKCDKEWLE